MAYSIDSITANCYPSTTVLVNKFDIRDEAKLNEVETVLVSARSAEWTEHPQVDTFDFAHYKAIHYFLFSDLYDWADVDGDLLMIATIQATQGVTNLLRHILRESIKNE